MSPLSIALSPAHSMKQVGEGAEKCHLRLWPGIWDPSPLLSASFPRVSQILPLRQPNSVSSFHPKGQCQGPGPTTHPSHLHITVWTALPHDSEPCTVTTPQTRQPMPLAFPSPPNRPLCMWKPVVHGQCKQHLNPPWFGPRTAFPQDQRAWTSHLHISPPNPVSCFNPATETYMRIPRFPALSHF